MSTYDRETRRGFTSVIGGLLGNAGGWLVAIIMTSEQRGFLAALYCLVVIFAGTRTGSWFAILFFDWREARRGHQR